MSIAPLAAEVSVFHGKTATAPAEQLTLGAMLERIRTSAYRTWIDLLRQCREEQGEEQYKAAKGNSVAFTPCCALTSRAQKRPWSEKLVSTTGIVHYDIDGLADAAAARAALAHDDRVVFAFVSPSGHGLKVGVAAEGITGPDTYTTVWAALKADFAQRYPALSVSTDINVKFLHALCFVSDDPDLYVNPAAVPFVMPPSVPTSVRIRPTPSGTREVSEYERVQEALRYIDADPREIWLAVGMALHSTGEGWARGLWDEWSQRSEKYDARDQDQKWAGFVEEGGRKLGTLFALAKKYGWSPPKGKKRASAPASVPFMGQMPSASAPAGTTEGAPVPSSAAGPPRQAVDPDTLLTDNLNARALVRDHGKDFRYSYAWDSWLAWTEHHWQRDTAGAVMQFAKQTIKGMAQQITSLETPESKALLKHIHSSLSTARLKAMLAQTQDEPGIPVQPEDLDCDPWLLNCTNGTVDLRTGERYDHRKEDLLTKCLDIPYDKTATCPTWLKFLWRIMGGTVTPDDPDMASGELEQRELADTQAAEMIAFLQRAVGYTLTGSVEEQVAFLLHGPTKTGKSTFLGTLRALLGPYAKQADMRTFMYKERNEIRNDIAALAGSRLVSALESQKARRLDEALVKQLTGGMDTMTARFLYEEEFTFKPQFKLFLATNHKPHVDRDDDAIWERLRLIPFTVQIPVDDRNKRLEAELLRELPGILAWAVQGCLTWQRDGKLGEPPVVKKATKAYQDEMDEVSGFLAECCVQDARYQVQAVPLHQAFQTWCESTGKQGLTRKAFTEAMEKRQFKKHPSNYVWWLGVRLRQDGDPELST